MPEFKSVAEAKPLGGLRLVLTGGVPGPWGESAKGVFHAKGIPHVPVLQSGGHPNPELLEWTGHENAPQAVFEDEPARTGWAEILFLAERIEPKPSLLPDDPADRALMFGLAHEICGEQGFGWSRRLMMLHGTLSLGLSDDNPLVQIMTRLGNRYGYTPERGELAAERAASILRMLAARLDAQRQRGSRFFVGDALTAVDIYWAAFCGIVDPLPPELCPMNDMMRQQYLAKDPVLKSALAKSLLEHRDAIYRDHLELPIDL